MNLLTRVATVGLVSGAAVIFSASAASADGAVANSCAAIDDVMVAEDRPDDDLSGLHITHLGCGEGVSNVEWATVTDRPFFVKVPGTAPKCFNAGTLYFPQNDGYEETTVITPTVRCPKQVIRTFSPSH